MEFNITVKDSFVAMYIYGFDSGNALEVLTDAVAKSVYGDSVTTIFKVGHDFDNSDYSFEKFEHDKFKGIYYTGASFLYTEDVNEIIYNIQSYDEMLSTVIKLHNEGRIAKKNNLSEYEA